MRRSSAVAENKGLASRRAPALDIVWFRGKELRVHDHEPLARALASGNELLPLFVVDPFFFAEERARAIAHRIQFLLDGLHELARSIEALGSRLLVVEGRSVEVVPDLARRLGATRVLAQRWTEPFGRERDRRIGESLATFGVPFEITGGETLAEPGAVKNKQGGSFAVFTPFARAFADAVTIDAPHPRPRAIPPLPAHVRDRAREVPIPTCESLGIVRNPGILAGGEAAAHARLERFLRTHAARYHQDRDRLDIDATSRMSVDLKFGTLSPRAVWRRITAALEEKSPDALAKLKSEILWREFAYHVLWNEPYVLERPFRGRFAIDGYDETRWQSWVRGATGYPVVDAAARQLLAEGFVPNRARMIAASFLVKHLQIDYRRGEAHYLAHLTDGDWANNNLNWQWCAGSGADAQQYSRVFNPVLQGEKFDPSGAYVRRWVPEIAKLDDAVIHAPWTADPQALRTAGVTLGKNYPLPIVDHREARDRFLAMVAGRPR